MGVLTAVEDAIVARVQAALGATVKRVESLPGGWSLDALKRALQAAPGVYAAFLGGRGGVADGYFTGRFSVYLVTKGALEHSRRRGNPRVIGGYDMIEQLVPQLDGMTVADVGTLRLTAIENLFREAMFDLGGTVYGLQFEIPNMPTPAPLDPATLDDFITIDATYDLDTSQDGEPEANDNVTDLNL